VFVVSVAALIGLVSAYRGDPAVQGPNYDAEVHEQLEAAIEAGDYAAWLQIRQDNNLPNKGRMFQVINEDNFDRYAELHVANLAGDTAKADAIRAELGLGQGMMKRGTGQGTGMQAHSSAKACAQRGTGQSCDGSCARS
jgi:hypothetical protein